MQRKYNNTNFNPKPMSPENAISELRALEDGGVLYLKEHHPNFPTKLLDSRLIRKKDGRFYHAEYVLRRSRLVPAEFVEIPPIYTEEIVAGLARRGWRFLVMDGKG